MDSSSSSPPPPFSSSRQANVGNGKPYPLSSRRLPPPCWTHEETCALIDAYRLKWYSLNRGNLKAPHWQEVAESVHRSCPRVFPPKTFLQCRHKVEKLRKRYRNEKQRSISASAQRSWPYFRMMESMEIGAPSPNSDTTDEEDEDDEADFAAAGNGRFHPVPNVSASVGGNHRSGSRSTRAAPLGARIKFVKQEAGDESPNFGSIKRHRASKGGSAAELVSAIRTLGEGFLRMERMKMDMARDLEGMRMEMEMKRTESILESQQRIVDAFVLGFGGGRNTSEKVSSPGPENS